MKGKVAEREERVVKDADISNDSNDDDDDLEVDSNDESRNAHQTMASPRSSNEPPFKQAKLTRAELYKPPTNEELNQLKETENLFHSTLFRMQVI